VEENDMHSHYGLLNEGDISVERVWCDERTGSKLVVCHVPTGLSAERVIGFDAESQHRRELLVELAHRFSTHYPPQDFALEHMWCGRETGASLSLRHIPSGITVARLSGYEPAARFRREMLVELFQRLRERENSHLRGT
jgi:hypothetical protein